MVLCNMHSAIVCCNHAVMPDPVVTGLGAVLSSFLKRQVKVVFTKKELYALALRVHSKKLSKYRAKQSKK